MLLQIIIATTLIGLISLVGVVIIFNHNVKEKFLKSLISLAAGSLLAVALLDLLPESLEQAAFEPHTILGVTLLSILFFFLLEKVIHWHHCRCDDCSRQHATDKRHLIYLNLTGDAIHNLIDGVVVAAAFMLDFHTGLIVTAAVVLHEIPQEISDFGILLYAGLTKSKALLYNFFTALTAIVGALIFYFFGQQSEIAIPLMAAFTAGNFIYLSTADLIPELHHETNSKNIAAYSAWLLIGVAIIFLFNQLLPHGR